MLQITNCANKKQSKDCNVVISFTLLNFCKKVKQKGGLLPAF